MVKDISSISPASDLSGGLSYNQVQAYMKLNWKAMSLPNLPPHIPGYVQLDHVYGLPDHLDYEYGSSSLDSSLYITSIPTKLVPSSSLVPPHSSSTTLSNHVVLDNIIITNSNSCSNSTISGIATSVHISQQIVNEKNSNSSKASSIFPDSSADKRPRTQSLEDMEEEEDSLAIKTPLLRAR